MRYTRKIASSLVLATLAAAIPQNVSAATSVVQPIPGLVFSAPITSAVISGLYIKAIDIAYKDWLSQSHGAKIEYQHVMIQPVPKSTYVYVRFVPRESARNTVGCTTAFGTEILYVIDPVHSRVVRREIPC
jgi:hypothetical protein